MLVLGHVLHLLKYLLEVTQIGFQRVIHNHLLVFFLVRMQPFIDHFHAAQFLDMSFLIQVFDQLAYSVVLFMYVGDDRSLGLASF